ncbi:MAG: DUF5615 family PIN-like protein [Myxococcales bacterium]|nr:DUF5615 family PIN-like protein [Myxococcales bacterium]
MKIVADINISAAIVAGLRSLGHDIERADAFLPPTATDTEIAAVAAQLAGIIVTRDQDFSMLLALSEASAPSVINLRHARTDPEFLINVLDRAIRRHAAGLATGAIVTVDERGVRVHLLPIGSTN